MREIIRRKKKHSRPEENKKGKERKEKKKEENRKCSLHKIKRGEKRIIVSFLIIMFPYNYIYDKKRSRGRDK